MRAIIIRWCAPTVQIVVGGLWATLATPSFAVPPPTDPVAYIEQIIPPGPRLADVAKFEGIGNDDRLKQDPVPLYPGDHIKVRPGTVLIVRMAATNKPVPVSKEYDVPNPDVPGVPRALWAWFVGALSSANQSGDGNAKMVSRDVKGPCYNENGKTNEPIMFGIPILSASRSMLASGNRQIFVSWQGGAPPFSVTLSAAETDKVLVQAVGVRGTCSIYLPRTDLRPGRYRLTLTDAANVKEEEDNLFVVGEAPAEPRELRDANLPEEARQIYAATWLAVQDRGTWAFEAQQRVAAMNCRSAAVQDWLRQWGSSTPCAEAKR